jgi:hypothetical protein
MSSPNEVEAFPDGVESYEGKVPAFLKLVYIGFTIFGISYWVLYKSGDGSALVQAFNALCQ